MSPLDSSIANSSLELLAQQDRDFLSAVVSAAVVCVEIGLDHRRFGRLTGGSVFGVRRSLTAAGREQKKREQEREKRYVSVLKATEQDMREMENGCLDDSDNSAKKKHK